MAWRERHARTGGVRRKTARGQTSRNEVVGGMWGGGGCSRGRNGSDRLESSNRSRGRVLSKLHHGVVVLVSFFGVVPFFFGYFFFGGGGEKEGGEGAVWRTRLFLVQTIPSPTQLLFSLSLSLSLSPSPTCTFALVAWLATWEGGGVRGRYVDEGRIQEEGWAGEAAPKCVCICASLRQNIWSQCSLRIQRIEST